MITEKDIEQALARVPGPDGRTPLPLSGALAGLSVKDGKAYASIAIDPAASMAMEPMRKAAEAAIRAVPGITGALVTLTSERPKGQAGQAGPVPAAGPGPRARAARGGAPVAGVDRIIAVASGKGGVGKSTVACNLALGLASLGLAVGVLDADIHGPSMPRLFGLTGKPETLDGRTMRPLAAHGLKIMSIGFLVEDETPMIWRGPMVMSAITQMLRDVAWGPLDILVVDMPPGTGDAQLTMAQAVPLAGGVIVSTPQDLALIDARRAIAMFKRVEIPVLGIVENMSYFMCPHCGTRSDVFAHGGARHEAERLGAPFLGEIPLHMAIRETSDAGRPVVASDPTGPEARAFLAVARAVRDALSAAGEAVRPAPRILIDD